MKLFWLTAEMPFPPNTGGRIVMFKRIEYLSKNNEIYLFSIIDSEEDYKYRDDLLKYCKNVFLYNRHDHRLRNLLKLVHGPYVCVSRWQNEMKKDIDILYEDTCPDFVVVDFPQMLGNISEKVMRNGRVVLNQHNTEYVTLRNLSNIYNTFLKRMASKIESYRLESLEKKYYERNLIKLYTFVSIEDKEFFENKYGLHNTYLIPVGTEISKCDSKRKKEFIVSYIGKMEYPANVEAAIWFANNVFKKAENVIPELKYFVVGKNPLPEVKALQENNPNIIVTGTVDNVDEYFEKSDIIVIPLFHGGGVKVKLLEALGHGKLVITTNKGIEGTAFEDKKELLVAESPEQYVELISDIYAHPEVYESIKEEGLKCVQENFTWSSIISRFEMKLKEMAKL